MSHHSPPPTRVPRRRPRVVPYLVLLLALPSLAEATGPSEAKDSDEICSYSTYAWDVKRKRAVNRRQVRKKRSALTRDERDPDAPQCTVCKQDQVELRIEGLPSVTVCRHFAKPLRKALTAIRDSGEFDIKTLKGYRPGRTRGPIVAGKRSLFSNHSYGAAIDINAKQNGLYRRCKLDKLPRKTSDISRCRLGVGGRWDPTGRPRVTIVPDDVVHREMTRFWKWGGALEGRMKDFMHFSVTGK